MSAFKNHILLLVGCLTILITGHFALADHLLVISSSNQKIGSKETSHFFEKIAAEMVKLPLQNQYTQTHLWAQQGQIPLRELLTNIKSQLSPGEKLDVFSVQHADDTFFPGIPKQELETLLPPGIVRRIYSTGCSMWGFFSARLHQSEYTNKDFSRTDSNLEHLQKLGVEEYVIYGNDNYTGPLSLPLLLSELKNGGAWIAAAQRASDRQDEISIQIFEKLKHLIPTVKKFLDQKSNTSIHNDISKLFYNFFNSRPVLGGSLIPQHAHELSNRNLFNSNDKFQFSEIVLAPTLSLKNYFQSHMPYALTERGFWRDSREEIYNEIPSSLSNSFIGLGLLIKEIFHAYHQAIVFNDNSASPHNGGCLPETLIRPIIEHYLKDAPPLKELCFFQKKESTFSFQWKWGQSTKLPLSNDNTLVVNTAQQPLQPQSLVLSKKGSLQFRTDDDQVVIKLKGIALELKHNLTTDSIKPDDKTSKKLPIPRFLLQIKPSLFSLSEDGEFSAKISSRIPGLSLKTQGELLKSAPKIEKISVLGIPINIQ